MSTRFASAPVPEIARSDGNVLSGKPAPELERLLSDAPAAREVGELAHVAVLVGEREGVLVVIEIQFQYLTLTLAHEWVVTY